MSQRRHLSWLHESAKPMDEIDISDLFKNDVTEPLSGIEHVRRYWSRGKQKMTPFWAIPEDDPDIDNINDIIDRIQGSGSQIWIPHPIARYHKDLYMGQGDGVKSAFLIPALTSGDTPIIRRSSIGGRLASELYDTANLLIDDDAAMLDGTGGLVAYSASGSVALTHSDEFSYFGRKSAKISLTGSVTDPGIRTTAADVVVGETYFGLGWTYTSAQKSLVSEIEWYDAVMAPILPNSVGSLFTGGGGEFVGSYVEGVAPAGAASAILLVRADGILTEDLWFDCLGITPYSDPEWWLPSVSPQVAAFSFVPTDGESLYASIDAKRLVHSRTISDEIKRTYDPKGNLLISADVVEVWEEDA